MRAGPDRIADPSRPAAWRADRPRGSRGDHRGGRPRRCHPHAVHTPCTAFRRLEPDRVDPAAARWLLAAVHPRSGDTVARAWRAPCRDGRGSRRGRSWSARRGRTDVRDAARRTQPRTARGRLQGPSESPRRPPRGPFPRDLREAPNRPWTPCYVRRSGPYRAPAGPLSAPCLRARRTFDDP